MGDPAPDTPLDDRLTVARVPLRAPLVDAITVDHVPSSGDPSVCGGCGHRYRAREPVCPSVAYALANRRRPHARSRRCDRCGVPSVSVRTDNPLCASCRIQPGLF